MNVGIRLEDKNKWEKRVALTPEHVKVLVDGGTQICVQRFSRRIFPDPLYEQAGAVLCDHLGDCDLVLGIKEMPLGGFRPGGAYMFFSHTIKGQPYNMKMLGELVDKRCTLLDYETVTDENKRRLIFFGRFAGIAGMIDTLWTLGKRLEVLGHASPLSLLMPSHRYANLAAAKEAVSRVAEVFARDGMPAFLAPTVIGITGYGQVSQGAQEILDLFPSVEVSPDQLADFVRGNRHLTDKLVKVIYREEDLVERKNGDPGAPFDLQDYYDNGDKYRSRFAPHLKLLTILLNGIYWDVQYPKLATAQQLKSLFSGNQPPRLMAVGDVTCDVDGSLACTVRDTQPGDPTYVYDPHTGNAPAGFEGPGLAVMAVGNLPCELPASASEAFSTALTPFLQQMVSTDWSEPNFDNVTLPAPIKRSVILWRGEFTPDFAYMEEFLK